MLVLLFVFLFVELPVALVAGEGIRQPPDGEHDSEL